AMVEGGAQSPAYDWVAETLHSLLPMAERLGIATAAEVDIETLAERLRREALEHNACMTLPPLVGAWTRLAGLAGVGVRHRHSVLERAGKGRALARAKRLPP